MALKSGSGRSKVMQTYLARVDLGEIEPNAEQAEIVTRLEEVALRLAEYRAASSGLLGFFRKQPGPPPRGLYLHGGVGRGKTMLMDLFFETVDLEKKRRGHFHAFMAEKHAGVLHAIAESGKLEDDTVEGLRHALEQYNASGSWA